MKITWLKRRGYQHFDAPVGRAFALKVLSPDFVARHAFSPLIHYEKRELRYKFDKDAKKRIIKIKERPIKYASHRDACIMSYYASMLNAEIEKKYAEAGVGDNVIAYRSIGKSNYDFASEAYNYAKSRSPVTILAFDVTSFFDTIRHDILKDALKKIIREHSLPKDWYSVFRAAAKFAFVRMDDIKSNATFKERMQRNRRQPIATVAELKGQKIPFYRNPNPHRGIAQGTPISASLSNLYMLDFDTEMSKRCLEADAMYRRYSDDILIICKEEHAAGLEESVTTLMVKYGLSLGSDKTERTQFDGTATTGLRTAQYLGFRYGQRGAYIRESSLARQWRKMRRAIKRTRAVAEKEIAEGRASKVYTKRLRRRFTALQFRNFSSYARRSARAFEGGGDILKQVQRFEREAERQMRLLEKI